MRTMSLEQVRDELIKEAEWYELAYRAWNRRAGE
jgi:hypothetical protein